MLYPQHSFKISVTTLVCTERFLDVSDILGYKMSLHHFVLDTCEFPNYGLKRNVVTVTFAFNAKFQSLIPQFKWVFEEIPSRVSWDDSIHKNGADRHGWMENLKASH